ncbi:MAG: Mur ligase family protein [Lachnospiraceae bacterium]
MPWRGKDFLIPPALGRPKIGIFLYFKEKKCDLVALETGMGGETDATNVVTTTQVSILASISMDHMQFLGNTLEEIAKVKGGIIKPGRPVAMTGQNPEVEAVIQGIAEKKNRRLIISRPEQAVIRSADYTGTVFDYKEFQNVKLSLLGKYQVINACTALEIVKFSAV